MASADGLQVLIALNLRTLRRFLGGLLEGVVGGVSGDILLIMYKKFYQLRDDPFNVTADPSFFFASEQHRKAFSSLQYGIDQRKGILAVIGEVGTGKTTLCRQLLRSLDSRHKTALILNPSFSDIQLLRVILKDFGINETSDDKFALVSALNAFLLEESARGNNVVLMIDEAQNLGVEQLEQIRLLSNLETEKHKLLQIVLTGQPELGKMLGLNSLRQLSQRISVRYTLEPLEVEDVEKYIRHRLEVAAINACYIPIFDATAIEKIFEYTAGTPRLINLICDRALLAGFVKEQYIIDDSLIQASAEEVLFA